MIFNARTIWGFYPVSYLHLLFQREKLIPQILSVLQKKTFPADIKCLQKETLNVCGINFSRFAENNIFANCNFCVHDMIRLEIEKNGM